MNTQADEPVVNTKKSIKSQANYHVRRALEIVDEMKHEQLLIRYWKENNRINFVSDAIKILLRRPLMPVEPLDVDIEHTYDDSELEPCD